MKLLQIFLTLMLLTVNLYCETSPNHTQDPLVVACEEYPPFEFIKDGKPIGIDIDIIQQIMKKLNVPVEFRFYPFARINMLMKRGEIDAATSISYLKSFFYFLKNF